MQQNELQRLIRLSKKTGDTLIIGDSQGGESVVILPVDRYEALIDAWAGEAGIPSEEPVMEMYDQPFEAESDIPELPLEEIRKMAASQGDQEIIPEPVKEPISESVDEGEEERFYLEPIEQGYIHEDSPKS